jgi:hypothetical protein
MSLVRAIASVGRLVLDGCLDLLLLHAGLEAAALDHEAGDDAMKNDAIEKTFVDVAEEICARNGRFLLEQFDLERAEIGFKNEH